MDTFPLPPRPDLDQYKKRAKELVEASRSKDPGAIRAWAKDWIESLARSMGVAITPFVQESIDRAIDEIEKPVRAKQAERGTPDARLTLAGAQFLIARAHSFESWRDFAEHVEQASGRRTDGSPFEEAAESVVSDELAKL